MRISDWSSDVCSSDLPNLYNCTFAGACGVVVPAAGNHFIYAAQPTATITIGDALRAYGLDTPAFTFIVGGMILGDIAGTAITGEPGIDRKSVVQGKSVSVLVDLGGRRNFKKKKTNTKDN